ncbi:sensor histidine kinase [Streptomyces sp. NPDC051985]|uniref:sensor histidine kinase n=1 Tax=Streptomyces sp. NPDC051985 TaxID=3155807 RepID=UPI00341D80F1
MPSFSSKGMGQGVAVGFLLLACVVDLLSTYVDGRSVLPTTAVLVTGLAAVLWPAGRRPAWLSPQLRVGVPTLVSALCSAGALVTGVAGTFGPGEAMILVCLLFIAVRHGSRGWAPACGVAVSVVLVTLPLRYYRSWTSEALGFMLVGLVLVGLVAGLASYLRSLDYRRSVAVAETRRAERLVIAADLHDFVAHHVTGILVQTQVARMMAASGSEGLDPVLAGIERAATESLASMRRTVGVLRDTHDETLRRPVGDFAAISDMIADFGRPGQKVVLRRDPAVPDSLPHEVQAAAFRVVQEALTNVRRHAADAAEVTVRLACAENRLEVSVSDDGRGESGLGLPEAARGGGFGLVGLTERVTALGGRLHAGPREPSGWTVRAVFPVPAPTPSSASPPQPRSGGPTG